MKKYPKPHSFIDSFRYAIHGIASAIHSERNLRIDLSAATLAVIAGAALRLSSIEWYIILILCGLVIAAELFNTAIEKSLDVITKEYNAAIKTVKDIAAGAVLVIAATAAIVGLIIFVAAIRRLV